MGGRRTTTLAIAASGTAAGLLLAGCASTATSTGGAGSAPSPSTGTATACASPWASWGPGMLGSPGMAGTGGMMGGSATPGHGDWAWGPGMMSGSDYWLPGNGTPVHALNQARQRASAFADRLGLHVGDVMQFTCNFYAELTTSTGQRATEVLVNPADGTVEIEYGPAMMWNSRYGMHAVGSATGPVKVSAGQARTTAQSWLDAHEAGRTTGDVDSYPGYYTIDVLRGGAFTGMLSVNATTGAVWNHTWHGTWIGTSKG